MFVILIDTWYSVCDRDISSANTVREGYETENSNSNSARSLLLVEIPHETPNETHRILHHTATINPEQNAGRSRIEKFMPHKTANKRHERFTECIDMDKRKISSKFKSIYGPIWYIS